MDKVELSDSPYCPGCGHCGYIDCDGVDTFLNNHVRGKTDCQHEDQILDEIIQRLNREQNELWQNIMN